MPTQEIPTEETHAPEPLTGEQAIEAGRYFEGILNTYTTHESTVVAQVGRRGQSAGVKQESVDIVAGDTRLGVARRNDSPQVSAVIETKDRQRGTEQKGSRWKLLEVFNFDTTQGSVLSKRKDEEGRVPLKGFLYPVDDKKILDTFMHDSEQIVKDSKRPVARSRSLGRRVSRLLIGS